MGGKAKPAVPTKLKTVGIKAKAPAIKVKAIATTSKPAATKLKLPVVKVKAAVKPKAVKKLPMALASATATVAATSVGNPFSYFVPATTTSATFKSRTKKGGYKAPQKFLKSNFKSTLTAPFTKPSSLRSLDTHCVISPAEVKIAVLECGYGPKNFWTAHSAFRGMDAARVKKFLICRLEMVFTCVKYDGHKAWKMRKFYEHLEPSDKTACSFILGGIGTFLTAQKWLHVGGDKLKYVLHNALYSYAVSPSIIAKSPDYLVYGPATGWHVFESKGGGKGDRPTRLLQGLEQLSEELEIGWKATNLEPVRSAVSVHTSVDADEVLEVYAVDPPAKRRGAKIEQSKSLVLIEDVCKLLLILDTIDTFRGLTGASVSTDNADYVWSFKNTDFLGGTEIGIPSHYLKYEGLVRARVAVYLAADEARRESKKNEKKSSDIFHEKLEAMNFSGTLIQPYGDWTVERIARQLDEWGDNYRELCAKSLDMENVAAQVWWSDVELVVAKLSDSGWHFTSGGLCIRDRSNPTQSSDD